MPESEKLDKSESALDIDNETSEKENFVKPISPPVFSEPHKSYLIAFVDCNFQKVNNILSKDASIVDMKNPFDGTALHFACKFNEVSLIRALIGNYKADVNGKTPLHYCSEFSAEEAARVLVGTYNAKKDIRDYNGKLPIDWVKPDQMESIGKILGARQQETLKEEKGLSLKIKQFGSFLTHDSNVKHHKGFAGGDNQRGMQNSLSTDTISRMNHLSASNVEIDKALKRSLGSKNDKSSNKYAIPESSRSFSGKFN